MCFAYLACRATSWAIRYKTTVAHRCHIGIEQRAYDEASAKLNIKRSCCRVYHRTSSKGQFGAFFVGPFHQFTKHFVSKIATVGKLKNPYATFIASLHHLFGSFKVSMIIHRHHARGGYLLEYCNLIKFCHRI